MSDSYLLRIEKALALHIATTVTPAKGRPFDLTGRVFRGRLRYGRQDPIPMVSILQAPELDTETNAAGQSAFRVAEKTYLIQGWAEDDPVNPTDPAHALMAEVKRALGLLIADPESPAYLLRAYHPGADCRVAGMSVGIGLVRPPDEAGSPNAYFWLPVAIQVVENLEDPYALP